MGEQVTRIRPGVVSGGYDEQGYPVRDEPVSAFIEIRAFSPQVSDETAEAFGAQVIDAGTVYADRGTDIRPADKLVIRGGTWQVEGNARDWANPFSGRPAGLEILVRRVS